MKTEGDWLAAASFERTHEILSAINTLSIHAKLRLARAEDPAGDQEVEDARRQLIGFLAGFDVLLRTAEQGDGTMLGTDPRMVDLARRYRSAARRRPRPSALFDIPVSELCDLVRSERGEDAPKLVECLRGLRSLLDQHSAADTVGILGDL